MSKRGFLLIVTDSDLQHRYSKRLENGWKFTETILASKWQEDTLVVGFISLDGVTIQAVCLVRRGQRVATYRHSIRFYEFVRIDRPIGFDEIPDQMSQHTVRYFNSLTKNGGGLVTSAIWEELVTIVRALRPELESELDRLENATTAPTQTHNDRTLEILQMEKDAYTLAIHLAGFESRAASSYTSWSFQGTEGDSSYLHAISREPIPILEDRAIDHDAEIFPSWKKISGSVTGERVFRNENHVLSIINVNRSSVESTLGVDLIYYQHEYKSFVLVQYKRMERENGVFRYRPNGSSYKNEIERMREFRARYSEGIGAVSDISQYRLNGDAFYFKLHEGETFNPSEPGLCKGMYIPLEYWEEFIDSPSAKGQRGGINISYENIGRYLNNTDFTTLVKSGWIGSRTITTGAIENIVESLISVGRSVTVAIKSPAPRHEASNENISFFVD